MHAQTGEVIRIAIQVPLQPHLRVRRALLANAMTIVPPLVAPGQRSGVVHGVLLDRRDTRLTTALSVTAAAVLSEPQPISLAEDRIQPHLQHLPQHRHILQVEEKDIIKVPYLSRAMVKH